MTIKALAEKINAISICGIDQLDRTVTGCYIGDLLSLAMSRIESGNVWITIQTNINTAAVAALTGAACILLCDSFRPDEDTRMRAETEGIPILSSEKSAYTIAALLAAEGI